MSQTAAYGDNIDKMSQKMGLSTDAYQEWDFIMQHCGTSIEALKPSMKTLANAAQDGKEEFEKLGISQEQLATLSQEDLFALTISRLQDMEEGTERTAIASALLGKGATELGALLNTSAEDTEEMRQQVHDLGGVMSEDAVKAAAAFQDSLQNMQTAFAGLKRGLSAELLPAVTKATDGLTLLFSGNKEEGLKKISEGVDELGQKLMDLLPDIIEVGGEIIMSLADAVIENLPKLIDTGMKIVNKLIDGLIKALPQLLQAAMQILQGLTDAVIQNLPLLVECALQMIVALAEGLAQALPELIPAIIDVVLQIVDTLIDNLPLLIQASITLFLGLVTGLIQAIPQIIDKLPELISSIIDALIQSIPLIIDCGIKLFVALIEALPQIIVALVKAVPQIVNALIQGFMDLKEMFSESGGKLMDKLKEGISNMLSAVVGAAKSVISAAVKGIRSFFKSIKEVGGNLMDKLKDGISGMLSSVVDTAKSIGKNIVDGIWGGISAGWDWLTEKVGGLAKSLFDSAKSALGISSPSKRFRYLGEMCVAGFDEGAEELMDGSAFGAAVNNSFATVAANTGSLNGGISRGQTFNFYDTQTSPDAIRRKVQNTMTFGLAGGI